MRARPRTATTASTVRRSALVAVVALGLAAVGSSPALAEGEPAPTAQNLPGVPEPGAPAAEWEAWVAEDRAESAAVDWAAEAAARGCTLESATLVDEVDEAYNLAMGAPADLVTVRVDLVESCTTDIGTAPGATDAAGRVATSDGMALRLVPAGARCASTSGPGTICLSLSGGRITASWQYRGSGGVDGFLRIYQISASSSGCPTGTTWHTSGTLSWDPNDTRSTSKTQTQNGAYSAHIWRDAGLGHTDWGATCAVL